MDLQKLFQNIDGLKWLRLEKFPETSRGIKTLRPVKHKELLLSTPKSLLYTVKLAFNDTVLGPILRSIDPPLSSDDTLAVFLLFIKAREEGYEEMRNHVKLLPSRYSTSLFFNDEELEICSGSSLYYITNKLKLQIKNDYQQLFDNLFYKHPDLFPIEKLTCDDYKWALCTIWSRGMDFHYPNGEQFRCIAPIADMFNHSFDVSCCHVYDTQSGVQILAGKEYNKGDEVFINYGPVPNNRLLRLYGFVIPDNKFDTYDLVLATDSSAPLYAQKVGLFVSAGLEVTATIPLNFRNPLPLDVLRYLRIQRLSSTELVSEKANSGARDIVSARNENEILKALIDACEGLLASFGIQLEELEASIASNLYQKGDNRWAAAQVSAGEQRILKMTLQKTRELLALVICAKCGKANDNNKRCGKCRKVVYCGADCQISHSNEHKAVCNT